MEIKTEADSNDVTDCEHNEWLCTGMSDYSELEKRSQFYIKI